MLGHNTTFSTEHVRPPNEPSMENSIGVITPHVPLHFPIGLTELNFSREKNIRIKPWFDNCKYIESKQKFNATIHLDAWWDSVLYCGACIWLPIPKPDRDFQHGETIFEGNQLAHLVAFDQEYSAPPKVVVWLKVLDIDSGGDWKLLAEAHTITTHNFALKLAVWGSAKLHGAHVTWIAYPASRSNIDSGKFKTSDLRRWDDLRHRHEKRIDFGKVFERTPKVYFALNKIDSSNKFDLHLKAYVTEVDSRGMIAHLDSWGDLNMYSAEGQWIAIQEM